MSEKFSDISCNRIRNRACLAAALFFFALTIFIQGCAKGGSSEKCLNCHGGIEHTSKRHPGCVSCHGGNQESSDKAAAHAGMRGKANPSGPSGWEESCGSCHRLQLERVKSNIMQTNAGMIRNIRLTWEGGEAGEYATSEQKGFNPDGTRLEYQSVAELDNLSGELYRKFCSRCHIGTENSDSWSATHASGCAACHYPWNDDGTYLGSDKSVKGKAGFSATHLMEPLPPTTVCSRCHNRSGRIGYSYQGLYDGNNALVPTSKGEPGPVMGSGARSLVHIQPDVHAAAGMECIDCHTSRDVMGDGYSYRNMYLQTEVACEDCHGSGERLPLYREVTRENDDALRESKRYKQPVTMGMKMIQTSKGRSYSNVFVDGSSIRLQGKRSGRIHTVKVITATPAHTIAGHGRLECYACHSRTVVQCYGCHTAYDKGAQGRDFIRGEDTPGAFSETEDYRMLYPFPLAINQRGRISPVTPGCQTFVTVKEEDGSISKTEYVANFKGKQQLRFAPFYSHNTGTRSVGCRECHSNPAFLGFGQSIIEKNGIAGTLICEKSDRKPLDGFLTMDNGRVRAFSAITRENSRPLSGSEVKKALSVNLCLTCHDNAADPIYKKRLNYRALDDKLHRNL